MKPLQSIITSFVSFSPFYKGVEEKKKKQTLDVIAFLCEKSRAIALVLPGLMAGWLAGCPACWLAVWQTK